MEQLDIIQLIENNPITKLSGNYNNELLEKIKEHFTDFEQQLFLSSFYCYLNHHPTNDFVIDLDNVWKWLGFFQKENAKRLLEKQFILDKDYKILQIIKDEQKKGSGGHNKKKILLNVKTFKSLCLKAGTKKADEIHEYYMKMEELIQETINEENTLLKEQLLYSNNNIEEKVLQIKNQQELLDKQKQYIEKENEELKEKTLLEQFPINTQCVYIGLVDNKTLGKPNSKMYRETVIKFGQSNNLNERVNTHKKTYENFRLYNAFKVKNKILIENCIKKHPTFKNRLRIVTIDDIAHRELIALDDGEYTIEKVEQLIKEIIKENEYNVENYNLLLNKNEELQNEIYRLKDTINEQEKLLKNNDKKIHKLEYDVTNDIKSKIASNYAICKYGYFLYAYQYDNMRFVCSITRQKDYDTVFKNLKELYPSGEMICQEKCLYPLTEKNMMFILKQNCLSLGQNKFEGSISFLISGDEEDIAINGTPKVLKYLKDKKEILDACIVGEPTCPNYLGEMIKYGRRGSINFKLNVTGKQGHVAYPELANNPIDVILKILSALKALNLDLGTENFTASHLEITDITVGNKAGNVIPAEAKADFNIRFNNLHNCASLTILVEEICRKYSDNFSLTSNCSAESFVNDKTSHLINNLSDAITQVTSITPILSTTGGTSDARFIKDYCQVIEFGLVNQTAHHKDEHVDCQDIIDLKAIYLTFLKKYFQ